MDEINKLKNARKIEVDILNRKINEMKASIQKIVSFDNSIINILEGSPGTKSIPKIDVSEEVTKGLKKNIKKENKDK